MSIPLNPQNMPDPNEANGRTDGPNVHVSWRTSTPMKYVSRETNWNVLLSLAGCIVPARFLRFVLHLRFIRHILTLDSFVAQPW